MVVMATAGMNKSKTEKSAFLLYLGVISLKYIHMWTNMVINFNFLALDQFS